MTTTIRLPTKASPFFLAGRIEQTVRYGTQHEEPVDQIREHVMECVREWMNDYKEYTGHEVRII